MKKLLSMVAAVTVATAGVSSADAQSLYAGVGLPGLYNLGLSTPLSDSVNVRLQHASGARVPLDGTQSGMNVTGNFKAVTTGVFADWFPSSTSGFRLVGGLSFNDIKAEMSAVGSGTTMVNDKSVNMTGQYYNVTVSYPVVAPYLGIGYGHHKAQKGLGLYADLGVMLGTFKVQSTTSLVGSGQVSQADVDAQDAKLRDSVDSLKVLPVVQVGVVFRY